MLSPFIKFLFKLTGLLGSDDILGGGGGGLWDDAPSLFVFEEVVGTGSILINFSALLVNGPDAIPLLLFPPRDKVSLSPP